MTLSAIKRLKHTNGLESAWGEGHIGFVVRKSLTEEATFKLRSEFKKGPP